MQVGEIWQITARREGMQLEIVTADCWQAVQPPPNITPAAVISPAKQSDRVRDRFQVILGELTPIAQAALIQKTKSEDWKLFQPDRRAPWWEWEARSLTTPPREARVRVNENTQATQVYLYPQPAADPLTGDPQIGQRLVVTPLGAARGIGASCFRVQIGPYEIVLDAGSRPKGTDPLPAFELLHHPNLILISHAHLDHIGALPVLHQQFPDVPMICTHGTREIAHVMLTDGLKVQQARSRKNEDAEALFTNRDLDRTLFQLQTKPMGEDFYPLPGLKVRFIHAGHIVGAACIYLEYGDRSLLYTGDYNTTSSRTAEGLKLADLPTADLLITESTYGGDTHPSRRTQESELLKAVAEVVQAGGNVLIPAFALGRAQEIILAIRTNAQFHSLNIPVYVDGLVREVTDLFQSHLDLLPPAVKNFAKTQSPFFSEKSLPQITPIALPHDRPLAMAQPSVIIASSGMLSGGASVYYAKTLLERENAAIFISGYTDEESPGRFLQTLEPGSEVELDGQKITVRAQIRKFNLSAHADRVGLTQVIHRVSPRHLILIHGSPVALHELARAGDLRDKYWIHIPDVGDEISYGTPPEHLSKAQIARVDAPQEFEIEVEAEFDGAWLRIPEEVMADPRWQSLSATGILTAKWTKVGLILKAATHKSLAIESAIASGVDCCAICGFFDGYLCQSEDSPLYNRDVDPSAKCPEFSRAQTPVDISSVEPLISQEDEEDEIEDIDYKGR
jgi:Cft2 family RNA processing exonuclease